MHTKEHRLLLQAGSEHLALFVQDVILLYRTILPFLKKWTRIPDNYEAIYQQMLTEIQQPDFESTWTYTTVWGTTPTQSISAAYMQVR